MNIIRVISLVCCGGILGFIVTPPVSENVRGTEICETPGQSDHPEDSASHENSSPTTETLPSVDVRFANDIQEIPDFQRHVGPLLGKLGCNGRACHGSFQGQGGFQLSLFGYDFDADHQAMMEDGSWRVDLEDPEGSLVLAKPTDADDHGGGERFAEDSWQYRLIKNWIVGGARNFDAHNRLKELKVIPSEIVTTSKQVDQVRVVAIWSDGTNEDVTPLVRFQSNDPQVASIDENGKLTGGSPGDTHVIVFYDNQVVSVPVISPVRKRATPIRHFARPTAIDRLVMDKLDKLGIEPSALTGDAAFLRRVCLDITGTLPTPAEIREFLDDDGPDKRSKKIEALLQTKAYAAWWTTFLCDLTGNSSQQLRNIAYRDMAPKGWYEWIYKRVSENVPYDEIVQGIVLSSSRTTGESLTEYSQRMSEDFRNDSAKQFAESPTMPYYWMRREFQTGDTLAISFAHSFLGVRIQCAQCHKHPFDQWTQDDFKQFARFFSGVSVLPAQRAVQNEKEELSKIYAKLNIDLSKTRGGDLRRKLNEAVNRGQTVPFPELVVGPPRKSREDLRAEREKSLKMSLATKEKLAASQKMASEMDQEMMDQADPDQMDGGMQEFKNDSARTQGKPLTQQQRKKIQRQQRLARRREQQRQQNRNRFYTDAILLGSDSVVLEDFDDARQPALTWLKHKDNPYFAKAIVNRIWARYFGIGIVEPADDLNLANPPSNGPLLQYLADGFVQSGYDMKWVHREIANSNIYQLSWEPNDTNRNDRRNFSHALPRRLAAEVVFDAIAQATASPDDIQRFRDETKTRAIAIPGTVARNRGRDRDVGFAMQVFGKSERNSSCDCDRSNETSLVQTVFMQNDRHVHEQLARGNGWIGQLKNQVQRQSLGDKQPGNLEQNKKRLSRLKQELAAIENREDGKRIGQLKNKVKRLQNQLRQIQKLRDDLARGDHPELVPEELVTEAWLRTLSRFPTEAEARRCRDWLDADDDLINGLTGIMWTLVNTKEFIVNH